MDASGVDLDPDLDVTDGLRVLLDSTAERLNIAGPMVVDDFLELDDKPPSNEDLDYDWVKQLYDDFVASRGENAVGDDPERQTPHLIR